MSLRSIILALFLGLTLLPQGWNKVDTALHGTLIYGLGALLVALLFLSWKELSVSEFDWRKKLSLGNGVRISALLLALWFVIAKISSPIQNFGWSEVVMMISGIGIFFIVQVWKEEEQKNLLRIILALGALSATFGLAQYLYRPESRITGPFFVSEFASNYWPNAFATFLLAVWPLSLMLQKRVVKIMAITLFISALLLTFSRAAFLVLCLQLVILAFIQRKSIFSFTIKKIFTAQIKTFLLITICVLALTGGLHTLRPMINSHETNSFLKKATFVGTEQQTSFQERFDFMKGAIQLMRKHPILGSGPFSFRFIYPTIQKDFLAIADHPHNWILKIGVEEGIPALLLFLILMGLIGGSLIYQQVKEPNSDRMGMIVLLSLAGPFLHSLADYNMNFMTNQIIFWIVLGFATTKICIQKWSQKNNNPHGITLFSGLVAVIICTTATSIGYEIYLSYTKNFEQMQFSRNYFLEMSGDAMKKNNLALAERFATLQIQKNPYDAFAWDMLGQINEKNKKNKEALAAYGRAIKVDPANFFNFYRDYFRIAKEMNMTDTGAYMDARDKALVFLRLYPEKVKSNIHYTAQTSNVQDAVALAKALGDTKLALKIQRALRDFRLSRPLDTDAPGVPLGGGV